MRFTFLVQLYLGFLVTLILPTCTLTHKYLLIELHRVKDGRPRILEPPETPAKNKNITLPPPERGNAGGNERKRCIVWICIL